VILNDGLKNPRGILDFLNIVVLWFTAGFIATMLAILWIWLSGGFVEIVTELVYIAVVESLPFPFNLIAGLQINPVSVIRELFLQAIIFIILILLIKSLEKT